MPQSSEHISSQRREVPLPQEGNRVEEIAFLSHEFRFPGNYNKIVDDFDRGNAQVRDVGEFTQRGRLLVVNSMNGAAIERMSDSELAEFSHVTKSAAHSFAEAMRSTDPFIQSSAGWNFLVNSSAYRDRGHDWAVNFDKDFGQWQGQSGSGIDAMLRRGVEANTYMKQRLALYADANPIDIAWHLAGRSFAQENYQRSRYERDLAEAKRDVSRTILHLADDANLPQEHLNRTLQQLHRADFSAFDHLTGGVTTYDANSLGDYQNGTLRVEVKAWGSPAAATDAKTPRDTLRHELFHSASAQELRMAPNSPNDIRFSRIGLKVMGTGVDANEGMTEFLNLLSAGRITANARGMLHLDLSGSYDNQVMAMTHLYGGNRRLFSALFNTYCGDSSNPSETRLGLQAFYDKFDQI